MSRKPGGEPSLKLYVDYKRFLEEGPGSFLVEHAALGRPVAVKDRYDARYRGGGDGALTDGVRGTANYRDPAWQGHWQNDLAATIDLGRAVALRRVTLGCLQQAEAGIFLPSEVRLEVSSDGREFREAATARCDVSPREPGPLVYRFTLEPAATEARFVRVTARNLGHIPDWHPARGQKAWLFVDEIQVDAKKEKR